MFVLNILEKIDHFDRELHRGNDICNLYKSFVDSMLIVSEMVA